MNRALYMDLFLLDHEQVLIDNELALIDWDLFMIRTCS